MFQMNILKMGDVTWLKHIINLKNPWIYRMRYPLLWLHFSVIGAELKSIHLGMPRGHPTLTLRVIFWYPDIFILSFVDHVVMSRLSSTGESQKMWSHEFEALIQYTWQNTSFGRGFWFQLLLFQMLEKGLIGCGYDLLSWDLFLWSRW